MNRTSARIFGAVFVLVMSLITSCGTSAAPSPTAVAAVTPEATARPQPLLTLKVASYNVLVGAGHDRAYDENIPEEFRGIDRTPMLMDYLRSLDADIIGLQETTGWDQGDPPHIQLLADELGMNSFASSPRSDASLLTRLEILEAVDLSTPTTSIIRARLRGPDGEPVNVYVAHLNWDSLEERACSTQFLLHDMERFADQRTFLVGDMNFKGKGDTEWSPRALRESGWQLLALDRKLGFDQIWAPASLQWDATAWTAASGESLKRISDHSPVGLEVLIFSPSRDERPVTAPSPVTLPEVPDLPAELAAAVSDVRLAFMQQAGVPCNDQRWSPYSTNTNVVGVDLHLYGEPEWQSYANWSAPIGDRQGMLLDFKFEKGSEFNIFLEHSEWGTPEFRKFGIAVGSDGSLHPDVWMGHEPANDVPFSGLSTLDPDTYYRLLLIKGGDSRLAAFVWPVGDPGNLAVLQRDMGDAWAGVPLRLAIGGNQGGLNIHEVKQVVFDDLQ